MGIFRDSAPRVPLIFFALPILSIALAFFVLSRPASAVQSVPYKMNFQGRLNDASGNPMSAGTYNMKFRIYDAASSGTLLWSEQRANSASTGVTVTTGGLFSVQLGDATSLPVSIFNNAASIYFEIELPTPATATCTGAGCESYTEGPMTPRNRLGTSAYAFNSDTLDGLDSSSFAQLSANNVWTGTNTLRVDSASALQIQNAAATNTLLKIDTSANIVQVGSATTDATANVFVVDSYNNATDPTGTTGAIYYNTSLNKFRCYQGGAWTDCVGAGGGSTLQAAYDTSSSPATITTTASKGVSLVAGAAPTADMFSIDNSANPTVTDGVDGARITYSGGAAAVEGAGLRVDYTPGSTSGGTWNGIKIVANATGAVAGVTSYALRLDGPTTPGAGTEVATRIGTGWDIGVDIQSGGLQLAAQTDPSSPAAGNLRIYAKDIAGRVMPKWIAPSGVDTPFQASLGFNRVSMVIPAGGTTMTAFGTVPTNVGTLSNPAPAATSLLTSVRRTTITSAATAPSLSSHRQGVLQVWRGNAANRGGFFFTTRIATRTLQSGNRAFFGLADVTTAPTNVDPTTSTTPGKIGIAINANTGNWSFVNNITGTAPTATALGSNFPVNNTDLYELVMYSAPNGSSIGYRVTNLSTGNTTTGSVSTNIPSNTTFLAPLMWMTNNATAASVAFDTTGWYLESDD